MLSLPLLLSVFRMIVLPVEFQDRAFDATPEQLQATVRQAEQYFNRQFGGQTTFEFTLAPVTTLPHETAYYGANYSDRKDINLPEAVRDACNQRQADINYTLYDNDSDGAVDNVFLLTAGPGEDNGGGESAIWPQQGRLSATGSPISIQGKRIDRFAVCSEGRLGVFCHEFGHVLGLTDLYDTDGEDSGGRTRGLWGFSLMDEGCLGDTPPDFGAPHARALRARTPRHRPALPQGSRPERGRILPLRKPRRQPLCLSHRPHRQFRRGLRTPGPGADGPRALGTGGGEQQSRPSLRTPAAGGPRREKPLRRSLPAGRV